VCRKYERDRDASERVKLREVARVFGAHVSFGLVRVAFDGLPTAMQVGSGRDAENGCQQRGQECAPRSLRAKLVITRFKRSSW
jgi:hypothetical protein